MLTRLKHWQIMRECRKARWWRWFDIRNTTGDM